LLELYCVQVRQQQLEEGGGRYTSAPLVSPEQFMLRYNGKKLDPLETPNKIGLPDCAYLGQCLLFFFCIFWPLVSLFFFSLL
jgi:hypothetical protein